MTKVHMMSMVNIIVDDDDDGGGFRPGSREYLGFAIFQFKLLEHRIETLEIGFSDLKEDNEEILRVLKFLLLRNAPLNLTAKVFEREKHTQKEREMRWSVN